MAGQGLPIGELSRRTDVKAPTIRYYESVDLLPAPPRTESNRRTYSEADVRRLQFIRHARELGFEVEAIRELLALSGMPQQSCAKVYEIARSHLAEIQSKIARLQLLEAEVARMVRACQGGRVGQCRIIDTLASHDHCVTDHSPDKAILAGAKRKRPR